MLIMVMTCTFTLCRGWSGCAPGCGRCVFGLVAALAAGFEFSKRHLSQTVLRDHEEFAVSLPESLRDHGTRSDISEF
jgi:hypothetical protein